jgi:hypothetical protein
VLRATQPLRGIASLSDLPPLPDLLDGIERAVQEMMRRKRPMPNPGDVFDAAAKAISRVSQEIATAGRADPDAAEAGEFAGLLGRLLEMDPDIVPIETLYHSDGGPHIVAEGTLPAPSELPGQLEMVSLGEHLKQAAQDLKGAESNTQRQLRAHGLAPTLRALEGAGPAAVSLVHTLRTAIAGGAQVSNTDALAKALMEVGTILSTWGQQDPVAIEQRLEPVCATIKILGEQSPAPAVQPAPPTVAEAVPQPPAEPVVATPPAPAETVVPEAREQPAGGDWLAASLDAYQAMTAAGSDATALAGVFGEPYAAPAAEIAPITDFCYSGAAALRQAMALREKLRSGIPEDRQDLVQEIFDLVELGLQEAN